MKRLLFILIVLFVGFKNYNALCSNSILSNIRKEANNINYSVDYYIENELVKYNITINNITPNIYFVDNYKKISYHYSDTNNGEVTISNYNLTSISFSFYGTGECDGEKLITKHLSFPIYNMYYKNELCSGYESLNVCKKWVNYPIGYSKFIETLNEYKVASESEVINDETSVDIEKTIIDIILDFYVKYYYILLGLTVLVCCVVIIIYNKKNNFKL